MTRIYVGNLPFSATDAELRELFAQHGTVESVSIITDRDTGRPRGFGFVTMGSPEEAQKAIDALNGATLDGRNLTVNEARPKCHRLSPGQAPSGQRGAPGCAPAR